MVLPNRPKISEIVNFIGMQEKRSNEWMLDRAQGSTKRHVTCVGERRDYVGSTDSGRAALRVKSSVGVCKGYKLVCTHLFVFEFDRRDEGDFRYMS